MSQNKKFLAHTQYKKVINMPYDDLEVPTEYQLLDISGQDFSFLEVVSDFGLDVYAVPKDLVSDGGLETYSHVTSSVSMVDCSSDELSVSASGESSKPDYKCQRGKIVEAKTFNATEHISNNNNKKEKITSLLRSKID